MPVIVTPNDGEYPVAMHTMMTPPTERTYKLILASALLSLFLGAAMGYALGYTSGMRRSPTEQTIVPPSYPQTPVESPATTTTAPEIRSSGGCVIGGCSEQLCGDTSDAPLISTCEYRSIYGCYASATCERQTDGQCGWTETAALLTCLDHPPTE